MALSTKCPLQKLYHTANIRTGDSLEEEGPVIARMVEDLVPSSQPTADGVAKHFPPLPPARVDDAPSPSPPMVIATPPAEFAAMLNVTESQLMTTPDLWNKYLAHTGLISTDVTPSVPQ
jgi:hypothetical protein